MKDFAPVTLAYKSPNVLVLHPSAAVTSVKELIELARAKPGKLNYGSSGSGSSVHMVAELFKSMARVEIVRVVYRGSGPAIINRLNQEIVRILQSPAVKAKFFNAGSDSIGSSPQQFAATIESEMAKWGKVIKDANIRAQ